MKLKPVCSILSQVETDKFRVVISRKGDHHIIRKSDGDKIMFDDSETLGLYERSCENIDVKGQVLVVGGATCMLPYNWKDIPGITITVMEIDQELIDLVKPLFPYVTFICADAHTYKHRFKIYDTIFLDIFHKKEEDYEIKQRELIDKYSKMVRNNNITYLKIHNIEI